MLNPLMIIEEEEKKLENNENTREFITLVYGKHKEKFALSQDIISHDYTIKAEGYVGFITLSDNYSIHIRPKIQINNIFLMLEYAYNLKSFELMNGVARLENVEDFFERLADILAKKVIDRNTKGLYRSYLPKTEPLPFIRGRINAKRSLMAVLQGSVRTTCTYEESTVDIEENEILLWTLYRLRQFNIQRENVKKNLRKAYRELVNKVSLVDFSAKDCINRFYNRLNSDYKPIHGICRFLLEHSGPSVDIGSNDFLPFTVYMPTLFESFVAEWLREHLPTDLRLRSQYRAAIDAEGKLEFRIDLILENLKSGKVLCVMDTKYKKTLQTQMQDIAQVLAYATKMQTLNAFLIYPSGSINSFHYQVGAYNVRGFYFDITGNIEEAGKQFLQTLLAYIALLETTAK